MVPACINAGCPPSRANVSDRMQLQKERAMAALDLAARNAADSARQLNDARQMLSTLKPADVLAKNIVVPPHELAGFQPDTSSADVLRLQNEVAMLRAEIDGLRLSHTAMTNALRTELQASNTARLAAEGQLHRLQAAFQQTQTSVQESLNGFGRLVYGSERHAAPANEAGGSVVAAEVSADVLAPRDAVTASDIQRRTKPIEGRDLYGLLSNRKVAAIAVAARIGAALQQQTLLVHDVVKAIVDVIAAGNHDCQFLAKIVGNASLDKGRHLVIASLSERIIRAPDARSAPILSLVDALATICIYSSQMEALRVFLFDLLRLRPAFELELFAAVLRTAPNVMDVTRPSALCKTVVTIICEALRALPDPHPAKCNILRVPSWRRSYMQYEVCQFAPIVQSATAALMAPDADQVVDGMRALELIALSRGWCWTCSVIVRPLWERITSCPDPDGVVRLISAVAVLGRTSFADTAASSDNGFLQAIIARLHSFLDKQLPGPIQVAAVDALVILSNGRLSSVRDVYTWFVTAPETVRSLIPASLREDIKFIGKQFAVR